MPAVSVAGAAFTVDVGAAQYESQITTGTVTTSPTILRTKTLDSVAFDQTVPPVWRERAGSTR